jgi:hypothetical protein
MNLHAAIVKSLNNEDMTASAIIGEAGAAAALNEHEYLEVQRSHGDDEDTEPPNAPSSAADIPSVYQTFPGAFAVGTRNVGIDDGYSITAPSPAEENEIVEPSPSIKPVTARVVQNTDEDYEELQEELHQLQRVLAERDNVAIAEVVAVDEEAQQHHHGRNDPENENSKGKRLASLLCGSRTKRIASSIALLVILGMIIGVAVPLSSRSTTNGASFAVLSNTKCLNAMNTADQNYNRKLNQAEYFIFVNTFMNNIFDGSTFPELPQPLKRNFWQWRNVDQINIYGSKEGEAADKPQMEFLNVICLETEATATNLPPTLDPSPPTMPPSAVEPDSPPGPPTSLPSVASQAPSLVVAPIAAPIQAPISSESSPPKNTPTFPCRYPLNPTC